MYTELLKEFREKNLLTEYVQQTPEFIKSELREVLTATSIEHRIEEMCDVCVLCENAIAQLGGEFDALSPHIEPDANASIAAAVTDCYVFVRAVERNPQQCYFENIILIMKEAIEASGYNFIKSMVETSYKILSREGAINPNTKKWEKYQVQNNLYTPDYSTCK